MRILHIQKVAGIGGSERQLLWLLPALADRGHRVAILVLAAPGSDRFTTPMRAAGVKVLEMPAGTAADPRVTLRITRVLRRLRPDVVHTHLVHADVHGLAAARAVRVPAVTTAHNVNPLWRRPAVHRAARLAYSGAAGVVAISDFVRHHVESLGLVTPGRTRVIPYGIDARGWAATAAERAIARTALAVGSDETAVGVAARCVPGKGHEVLFAAVASARRQAGSLRLLVAGDGPLLPELRRIATDIPVSFLGHVADVRTFLHATDALVFPTQRWLGEGFGLAALEAMAAGVPVVTSDAGALPEVIDDGQTGMVVPAGSVRALSGTLVGLAADPVRRAVLGEAGQVRAREVFSLDRMVDSLLDVYGEVR
ncbi:MAG: glycosyltransferase family 4 protein [Actinomycetota bacterium]